MVKPRYVGLSDMSNAFPGRTDRAADTRLKVFISYSRKDNVFAEELLAGLEAAGFEPYLDKRDIAPGEVWEARLARLILEADTVVYVISPDAVASKRCVWEIEETERLAKRLLPVVCRAVEEAAVPERLRRLNYTYFDKPNAFGTGLKQLARALNTDLSWLREHTHMLEEATRWHERGRIDALLLRGSALDEAKSWLSRQPKNMPEPTEVQRAFIVASDEAEVARNSKERQELAERASMQEAREAALRREEIALKEVAEAQRRKAKLTYFAYFMAVVMSISAGLAGWQYRIAEASRELADGRKKGLENSFSIASRLVWRLVDRNALDRDGQYDAMSVLQIGVSLDSAYAMAALGWLYSNGEVTLRDYLKANEWFEKAAAKGEMSAMTNLGSLYANGHGVAQDYAKAREWYEKAAEKGDASAMTGLGSLYHMGGPGLAQDRVKAQAWFERAIAKGEPNAVGALSKSLQQYEEAAAQVEAAETKEKGEPGEKTVAALNNLAWVALLARNFEKALAASGRAHGIRPTDLVIETNRAHALLFGGDPDQAKALYLSHKGKLLSVMGEPDETWEATIAKDFADLRKAGLTHPLIDEVKKALGVDG